MIGDLLCDVHMAHQVSERQANIGPSRYVNVAEVRISATNHNADSDDVGLAMMTRKQPNIYYCHLIFQCIIYCFWTKFLQDTSFDFDF